MDGQAGRTYTRAKGLRQDFLWEAERPFTEPGTTSDGGAGVNDCHSASIREGTSEEVFFLLSVAQIRSTTARCSAR